METQDHIDMDTLAAWCDTHTVTSADTAREVALDWQSATQDESLSYGELAAWSAYFSDLADKFPELRDEFKENGII